MAQNDVEKRKERPRPLQISISDIVIDHRGTNYLESFMHLFKGAIGVGLFAMGDAFKNGGIYVAPAVTLLMGFVCVHCQHVLLNCTEIVSSQHYENKTRIDYPEAVELCFEYGPPKIASVSEIMGTICNCFIFITQLGFCCIYLTVIATNVQQILQSNDVSIDIHYMLLIIWVPTWIACLITNLKALAPVSSIANAFLLSSFLIAIYFAVKDGLPGFGERRPYTSLFEFVIFFGTVVFSFEGISLVLPLKNAMTKPEDFQKPFGVLNMGMIIVVAFFMLCGFCGYLKYGEDVADTITLNIGESILAQCTKGLLSLGIMLSYPLQFFIPCAAIMPVVLRKFRCENRPLLCELISRSVLCLFTVLIAEAFPNVSIFISLIGGLCSTVLALIFPPIMECLLLQSTIKNSKSLKIFKLSKNCIILMIAFLSFTVGTYVNILEIVNYFKGNSEAESLYWF